MGYTHYYHVDTLDGRVAEDAKAIVAQAQADGIVIAGEDGHGYPELGDAHIALNGSAIFDEDYEPFVLPDEDGASFCKTARRPYDVVVAAILVSVFVHGNGYVASDGTIDDWEDGISLYERATGRRLPAETRESLRRTLDHDFRDDVIDALSEDGFSITSLGKYGAIEVADAEQGGNVVASGSTYRVASDALSGRCDVTGMRLAHAIRAIVDLKRSEFVARRSTDGTGDWFHAGDADGFDWFDALCY